MKTSNQNWLTYRALAETAIQRGDLSQAEEMWLSALKQTVVFEELDIQLSSTLDKISSLYQQHEKYDQAETYCQKALVVIEKLVGKRNHYQVANCLNNLAGIYYCQGLYGQAEPICLEVLSIYQSLSGANYGGNVGMALNNLAMLYHANKKLELAEQYYLQAISIRSKLLGPSNPIVITLLKNYENLRELMTQTHQTDVSCHRSRQYHLKPITTMSREGD